MQLQQQTLLVGLVLGARVGAGCRPAMFCKYMPGQPFLLLRSPSRLI